MKMDILWVTSFYRGDRRMLRRVWANIYTTQAQNPRQIIWPHSERDWVYFWPLFMKAPCSEWSILSERSKMGTFYSNSATNEYFRYPRVISSIWYKRCGRRVKVLRGFYLCLQSRSFWSRSDTTWPFPNQLFAPMDLHSTADIFAWFRLVGSWHCFLCQVGSLICPVQPKTWSYLRSYWSFTAISPKSYFSAH